MRDQQLTLEVQLMRRQQIRNLAGTHGNVYFVVKSTEAYLSRFTSQFQVVWEDGSSSIQNTVEAAYALMTSNYNDVMVLDTNSTHALAAMVTSAKNRCHFTSFDAFLGINRAYGAGAKVEIGVTTAATNIAAWKNTGVRNSFKGIKFISNDTVTEGLYAFVDGGEYTYMENCEVYKSTDMDQTGAADFVCNADSPRYVNCTFGSLATARSGAVIRAAVLFTKAIAGAGLVTRDATFDRCNLWLNATNTANRFAYGANATDIERLCIFDNCNFICNGASSAIPAQNVSFAATLTVGSMLLKGCTSVNAGTAMSTTTGVFVDGPVPAADTTGIALQAT